MGLCQLSRAPCPPSQLKLAPVAPLPSIVATLGWSQIWSFGCRSCKPTACVPFLAMHMGNSVVPRENSWCIGSSAIWRDLDHRVFCLGGILPCVQKVATARQPQQRDSGLNKTGLPIFFFLKTSPPLRDTQKKTAKKGKFIGTPGKAGH